jgi:hypothetical protein
MESGRELRERMELARARAEERARGDTRRDLAWTALRCVLWCLAGLALMAWALHTTDAALGRIAFSAGIIVGNGGMLATGLRAYLRGERRGDW